MSVTQNVITLKDEADLRKVLEKNTTVAALYFYADWAHQCKNIGEVIDELGQKYPQTPFFKIEAENFPDISEAFEISAVPTVIFVKGNKALDRVDGVNAARIAQLASKYSGASAGSAAAGDSAIRASQATLSAEVKQDLNIRLKELINRAPVMVFIKGTPSQPRCGFSKQVINILNDHSVQYGYFDILTDEEVRQGLKEYSEWPTYPQLYIKGELIGGLDIIKEMIEGGEFDNSIPDSEKLNNKA
ncbi:glutaredoxin [Mycoemilia scoparia]|uniref:Glutaredoxin n=1 Tax=Mycoemilia scoparia TaxID=417184 RepID=A0A9W8A3I6_9FUNG|nr:glutaredoxin [Mycoemilia scoparia]